MIDSGKREYITSVKYIYFMDETIPPTLLNRGVKILHLWCQHNDLDGIGSTETDYTNNDIALEWL